MPDKYACSFLSTLQQNVKWKVVVTKFRSMYNTTKCLSQTFN